MQKTKKILSALLALVMVIGIMPAAAFASPCELEEHTHGEGCYTLTCELSEHSHTACDLSCDKVAHAHCYDDKCEIEAHKHTACDLSCDKEAHAHCYTFTCEKAEHKHNDDCAEKVASELVTDIDDLDFIVGVPQEFTFETKANDDAGVMVVGLSDFSDPDALAKLEYYEPNTDTWYDLNGAFGGSNGFPMADAASKFRATFAKAGEYTFTSVMKTVDGGEVLCSVEATAKVRDYKHAELLTNIGDIEFVVGEAAEFTFSTVANDDKGLMVVGLSDFDAEDAIAKLEYYEPNTDTWYDLNGAFGGSNGFPMADATSKFRVTFAKAGEYEFTSVMKLADSGEELCSVEATAVVVEAEPDAPEIPEEPVTPDIDPDARCGKYEHKHNACDLSCKLYTHTHCHGDTCEIEEHKHTACDLSCDKAEHIHCYPATETPDEPELPEEPEQPEEPVIPELPKPEEVEGYELNCETPAHKHNACDLSCPYDAHEHCFSDTCKIEAHVHNACDLSCDKDVHVHCYTLIEDEEPETPETPDEPEAIVVTKVEATIEAPVAGEAIPMTLADIAFTPDIDVVADDVYLMWAKNADTNDVNGDGWEIIEDEDAVFEDGFYYAVVIFVELPDDVVFADEYTALMNGKAFDDVAFEEGDDEFAPLFSAVVAFDDLVDEEPETPETPDEPETPVVPDVDGYKTNCAKEEHKHTACDLSCDKEAHTHCFSDKCDKDHEHCYVKIEEEPEAPEYSIITGANGTWKDSATDGMTFASDAEFADFVSVKVDGAVVDAANYDAKEGSTVITLKNAYLKTLKEGEHSLTIVSKDGEASTKFTIEHEHKLTKVEAKKETCVDKGNSEYYTCECGKWFKDDKAETEIVDKTSVEIKAAGHKAATEWSRDAKSHWHKCTVCKEAADEKKAHDFDKETGKICQTCKYDVDNPKTGSEAHITVMAVLMTMSVVVMAGVAGYFVWDKKRKH